MVPVDAADKKSAPLPATAKAALASVVGTGASVTPSGLLEDVMSDKPAAGLAAAALALPFVLLCCLGPAAVASLFAGFIAWLGGFGSVAVAGVTVAAGLLAYRLLRGKTVRLRRGGRP
jgi:hypothetical protein